MNPIRIVAFPEAGEGVELIFRNRDLRSLYAAYGEKYMEIAVNGILLFDVDIMDKCLAVSAKKNGDPLKIAFDDLDDVKLDDLQVRLLDALNLAISGRTAEEQSKWVHEQIEKRITEGAQSPLLSPGGSSAGSTEPPAGPGSATPSSGSSPRRSRKSA